ncbi:MAG: ABC transporter ATP-binding protein/permease [Clostridiales bacterium]|nr:ABC transporter ATP-binding protein/permease [Clostridiales bacterium]
MKFLSLLGRSKKTLPIVLIILCLLAGQAYCELMLPNYMSNVVNVGIMQGGVETAVPQEIRETTMQGLSMMMSKEDQQFVAGLYKADPVRKGVLKLSGDLGATKADQEATMTKLDTIFTDAIVAALAAQGTKIPNQLDTMRTSAAVAFVQAEYKAIGVDMQAVQNAYMKPTATSMILFASGSAIAAILVGLLASLTAAGIGRGLRRDSFTQVMRFSGVEMEHFSPASLITRSTNDIQQIQMTMTMFLRMVLYAPVMAVGGILMVGRTDTGLSWIIVVAVVILAAVIGVLLGLTMPKFQRMQPLIDDVNLVSREILTGLPVIRAFCREDSERERFDKANTALYKTQLFTNRAMVMFFPLIMVIMNIVTVGIVWFGGHNIDAGVMKVGDLMAFISYTMFIVMSFMMLSMIMVMLPRAAVAAGRVLDVIHTKSSLSDKPAEALRDEEFLAHMKEPNGGRIVFDDVNFRFHDAEEDTLLDVSFTAEPGQTTAIIGGTGSGKSTLVQLVPRLFDVTKGSVTIDGIDVRDVSQHTLRSSMGFVPQKGMLFSGTIESNLKYAGPQVTDEDIRQASEIAQAASFIEEKEDGFESPVAQGGSNVSGGQRQRLAIARALAEKPKILVFDDSFSALDFKTDANLRRALAKDASDTTILIVAQRIATILRANKIIVLDEGRIVGEGTHQELMQSCELYQDIARSQLSEEELCA